MYRILVLEDEIDFAEIMSIYLKKHGYSYELVHNLSDAKKVFDNNTFDLVLTDLMLPDGSGSDFCKYIRETSTIPLIVISCLDDDTTIVNNFSFGADDYITKPLQPAQFIARIEANIRRTKIYSSNLNIQNDSDIVEFCNMTFDKKHKKITLENEDTVELSPIEFTLLCVFLENQDTLILYEHLYKQVWDKDSLGDYRTIMVHVSNLKKKIDPLNKGIITNVRGAGYLFTCID